MGAYLDVVGAFQASLHKRNGSCDPGKRVSYRIEEWVDGATRPLCARRTDRQAAFMATQ